MGMTAEDILKAVREQLAASGEKNAVETVKALDNYMRSAFGAAAMQKVLTPGEEFIANSEVKDYYATKAHHTSKVDLSTMPRYGLKAGDFAAPVYSANAGIGQKATVTTTLFPSERTYLPPAEFPQRKYRLRELIPVAGLATPQVEYAQITGYTNSAGAVAESTQKPESAIQTQLVVDSVKQIATFIPVTRQALRDVSVLGAYLNQVLAYFLQLEEDRQILSGNGSSEMTGILNVTGVQTQTFSSTIIETVRKAITKLEIAFTDSGFLPTGLVMHPTDWQTTELLKDSNGRYIMVPYLETIANGGEERMWKVPVIVTPAKQAGSGLLGAWDIGSTLFTYDPVTLRMTDSHADFFIRNLIAVLAEFRELLAVHFPSAFCIVNFS